MSQFYYCPSCRQTMSSHDVNEAEEFESSEFWGVRAMQRFTYFTCGTCGDDVQETEAPEEINNEDNM